MALEKVWVGLDHSGRIVTGGHNRQRFYHKDRENAIRHASKDNRIVALVEFNVGETIWKRDEKDCCTYG